MIFLLKYVRKFVISVTESSEYMLSSMFLQKLLTLIYQASFRVQIDNIIFLRLSLGSFLEGV